MIQASSRQAIQYTLAALIAFAGGAVLLKGTAIPLGSSGGTAGPGLLSYVVAALLALTGVVLIVMAVAEVVHARRPTRRLARPRKASRRMRAKRQHGVLDLSRADPRALNPCNLVVPQRFAVVVPFSARPADPLRRTGSDLRALSRIGTVVRRPREIALGVSAWAH